MDRFWAKVDISENNECLEWTAAKCHGYGWFGVDGKPRFAHRFIYEATNGKIPEGMVIDHICRNRACVNTVHMRVVTRRQNTLENSEANAAKNIVKTHCSRGHIFIPENMYLDAKGGRHCKVCEKARKNTPESRRIHRDQERIRRPIRREIMLSGGA